MSPFWLRNLNMDCMLKLLCNEDIPFRKGTWLIAVGLAFSQPSDGLLLPWKPCLGIHLLCRGNVLKHGGHWNKLYARVGARLTELLFVLTLRGGSEYIEESQLPFILSICLTRANIQGLSSWNNPLKEKDRLFYFIKCCVLYIYSKAVKGNCVPLPKFEMWWMQG